MRHHSASQRSFELRQILNLYTPHYKMLFDSYRFLYPLCHRLPSRGHYPDFPGAYRANPGSTSQIIVNTLEAICKPETVWPFSITYPQPLWFDFVPFGPSVAVRFRPILRYDSFNGSHYTLPIVLILAVDPEPGLSDFPRCRAGILHGRCHPCIPQ